MPWGDYGNVLAYGFISKEDTGEIIIERVGPNVPNIYLYNKYIAVVENCKEAIEDADLKGYSFILARKKKIVELNWEAWDESQKIPDKPKSGEPEDFIIKRKHNSELAQQLPNIWVMIINNTSTGNIDKSKKGLGEYSHLSIDLSTWDGSDVFRTPQLGHVLCTENAKKVFEQHTNYLSFFEIEAH